MKSRILLGVVCLLSVITINAQKKWEELTDEQKLTQLKSFRDDNQKYLKDTLKLTSTQMTDLDNLNVCFLSTLDRVDRYAKDAATKEKYADALWQVRWAQVDAIIGKEKHDKYAAYLKRKLTAALHEKQI
jgi:hypothetical protein